MKKNKRGLSKHLEAIAKWEPLKPEIENLYYHHKWSHSKIAVYYGVSQTAMGKIMKRLEIQSLGHGRKGDGNGNYKDGSESTLYRLMIQKDKCSECQETERLAIHHKNFNHFDNHLENLQVLCDSCHNRLHKTRWWAIKRSMNLEQPAYDPQALTDWDNRFLNFDDLPSNP